MDGWMDGWIDRWNEMYIAGLIHLSVVAYTYVHFYQVMMGCSWFLGLFSVSGGGDTFDTLFPS